MGKTREILDRRGAGIDGEDLVEDGRVAENRRLWQRIIADLCPSMGDDQQLIMRCLNLFSSVHTHQIHGRPATIHHASNPK